MDADDIKGFISRRPFKPFRITLVSGDSVPIRHPECIIVGERIVAAIYRENGSERPSFFELKDIALVDYTYHNKK